MTNESRRLRQEPLFCEFMVDVLQGMIAADKKRCYETYLTTLNNFKRFLQGGDIEFRQLDSIRLLSYQAWLIRSGVTLNTVSFYMRVLRAVYNRAVDRNITVQTYPFKHVYTGIEKTVKRAVSLNKIREIYSLDLSHDPKLEYARDMFILSFFLRGMSFVDMAFLKKSDLVGGRLTYRRRKTNQLLVIKWEPVMQRIVQRYGNPSSIYLLPIIEDSTVNVRSKYKNGLYKINYNLKRVGSRVHLSLPLTMYVARHSWASIARSRNIPLSVISQGMGHDSESTTKIYLASLETNIIDRANQTLIKLLEGN